MYSYFLSFIHYCLHIHLHHHVFHWIVTLFILLTQLREREIIVGMPSPFMTSFIAGASSYIGRLLFYFRSAYNLYFHCMLIENITTRSSRVRALNRSRYRIFFTRIDATIIISSGMLFCWVAFPDPTLCKIVYLIGTKTEISASRGICTNTRTSDINRKQAAWKHFRRPRN